MITPPPLRKEKTRRERRIDKQRQILVEAAANLFAQKGYLATTTKEIAEAADIGESTLYGYFASKKDILEAILATQGEVVDSLLSHIAELEERQSFVDLVDLLMEKVLSNAVYNRVILAESWTEDEIFQAFLTSHWRPVMQTLQDFVSKKIKDGSFRAMDTDLATRMMVACFIAAVLPMLRGVQPMLAPADRHDLAEMMVDIISIGLVCRKEQADP